MPRQVSLIVLGLLVLASAGAQSPVAVPVWTLSVPDQPVRPGVPFTVRAEIRLPTGYYQDADSAFLSFEGVAPLQTQARSASPPDLRQGKNSFHKSFWLERRVVLPLGTPGGETRLVFDLGWQICQVDGVCLLPANERRTLTVSVDAPASAGFLAALLGAFLGGLLLNLMPCVFPVLALKALSLTSGSRVPGRRRVEALVFAGGSVATVTGLGLAAASAAAWGQRLEWGFAFQQPVFVAALSAVFGFLVLSLFGIVPWSGLSLAPRTAPSQQAGGMRRAAAGGALLVLTAAPCTAPLLGPALGFALTQPPAVIPLYFLAIGLGLALPLLLVALVPAWARWLPKPSRWTTIAERVAGVLLAGTVGYLWFILASQTGWGTTVAFVAALVVAGVALWVAKRPKVRLVARVSAAAALVLAAGILVWPVPHPSPSLPAGWQAYSRASLYQALSQGHPVLVDATAAWCATCQVNEAAVLLRPDVSALFDRLGIVRLRADYTRPDPAVRAWLVSVERAGLPVYALYRPGSPPVLFPELLTDENFTRRLEHLVAE